MNWIHIIQASLSLSFVIGLLFLTVWFFKYCEQKGMKSRFFKQLKADNQIKIIEQRRLDAKNSLLLIEVDNKKHLLLYGLNTSLLIDSKTITKGKTSNE